MKGCIKEQAPASLTPRVSPSNINKLLTNGAILLCASVLICTCQSSKSKSMQNGDGDLEEVRFELSMSPSVGGANHIEIISKEDKFLVKRPGINSFKNYTQLPPQVGQAFFDLVNRTDIASLRKRSQHVPIPDDTMFTIIVVHNGRRSEIERAASYLKETEPLLFELISTALKIHRDFSLPKDRPL
jgi:hypothetical protein